MNDERDPSGRPPLRIKVDDEVAKARFANLAQVGSGPDHFVLDFAFVQGNDGWLLSRVILSPGHAKRFHAAIAESIARYEERFGPISSGPTLQ